MESVTFTHDEYQLGPFIIKGKENLLLSDSGEVVIKPKVMHLLLYLCQHSEKVVTFDELNTAIWPKEVVGDNAIYNLVGQLRKVLGDSASKPIYIQSISKVGYRLIVTAKAIQSEPSAETLSIDEQASSIAEKHAKVSKRNIKFVWGITISLVALLFILGFSYLITEVKSLYNQDDLRQLKLANYQLYRGDGQGINQAIETLQQLVIVAPEWPTPKLTLAFAYVRNAKRDPSQESFWLEKARVISNMPNLGINGKLLTSILQPDASNTEHLKTLLHQAYGDKVLVSAKLAFSELLFQRGKTKDALTLLTATVQHCMDCPFVYRKLANVQIVQGLVEEGFKSYTNYRQLSVRAQNKPKDDIGLMPLTFDNVKEMAQWHFQTDLPSNLPENLPRSQRNTLALFYLSLDRIKLAENILISSPESSTGFYDLYTHAAIAGAKGDFAAAYELLQKRQLSYPDNDYFKLSVVFALWTLEKHEQALQLFKQFNLLPINDNLPQSMSFAPWSLYAALLLETGDESQGREILQHLEQQLSAGLMPGSQSANTQLASILALLGKDEEALEQLTIAIKQGWVSDFNQNWWNLEDSPYFRSIKSHPRFKQLVNDYHHKISGITKTLN